MTNIHEEQERTIGKTTNNLTLDGMIGFVDYLKKEDINFGGSSDILRLDLLKRLFEEAKIEFSIRRTTLQGLFDHYKLVEQEFGKGGSIILQNKNINEKLDYVRMKGKQVEPSAYYNALASLTTYANLMYGLK